MEITGIAARVYSFEGKGAKSGKLKGVEPWPSQYQKTVPPTTPGEIILEEFLVPLEMSQAELARKMGVPTNRISQLVGGKRSLTAETALRLEAVLGVDATTWMNLQAACDL